MIIGAVKRAVGRCQIQVGGMAVWRCVHHCAYIMVAHFTSYNRQRAKYAASTESQCTGLW
jgi:hypothetical protein